MDGRDGVARTWSLDVARANKIDVTPEESIRTVLREARLWRWTTYAVVALAMSSSAFVVTWMVTFDVNHWATWLNLLVPAVLTFGFYVLNLHLGAQFREIVAKLKPCEVCGDGGTVKVRTVAELAQKLDLSGYDPNTQLLYLPGGKPGSRSVG